MYREKKSLYIAEMSCAGGIHFMFIHAMPPQLHRVIKDAFAEGAL
jgi:hypothetical protein